MKRSERLKVIRHIIKNNRISSQDMLITELKKKGFEVTQATVSRDIKFLNLVKVRDVMQNEFYAINENAKYKSNPTTDQQRIRTKFAENVVSVERAKNIVVVKTNPGEAQGVAAAIDGFNFEEILGTVAGDDTIICIVRNDASAQKITDLFRSF